MGTTRAVILARGLGSRMRRADADATLTSAQASAADAGAKGMMPIDRPFLDYVISGLADAGITDVCLVIGPEHDAIRAYYGHDVSLSRVKVHFAVQEQPSGTADAVAAARAFAGPHTVLVLNADNYYPVASCRALAAIGASGLVGFDREQLVARSNIPAERLRAFALVVSDAGQHLVSIIEKPDEATWQQFAPTSRVSMNLWSFTPVIFEACARVQPSPRGELELQDAVRIARDELGEVFTVIPSDEGVLDLSSRRDIPAVTAALQGTTVQL